MHFLHTSFLCVISRRTWNAAALLLPHARNPHWARNPKLPEPLPVPKYSQCTHVVRTNLLPYPYSKQSTEFALFFRLGLTACGPRFKYSLIKWKEHIGFVQCPSICLFLNRWINGFKKNFSKYKLLYLSLYKSMKLEIAYKNTRLKYDPVLTRACFFVSHSLFLFVSLTLSIPSLPLSLPLLVSHFLSIFHKYSFPRAPFLCYIKMRADIWNYNYFRSIYT